MRSSIATIALLAGLVLSLVVSLAVGSEPIAFSFVAETLWDWVRGKPTNSSIESIIIVDLRFPRAVLALATGGGLAVAGVAMQALIRNPLAEPFILGVSGGASVGASFLFLGFIPLLAATQLLLPVAAFTGGLAAVLIVYAVARKDGALSIARLLLAGVAMSALMGAITTYLVYSAPDPNKIRSVLFWLLGSFNTASWSTVWIPALASLLTMLLLWILARQLDAFLLGEAGASSIGIPVETVKKLILVLTAFVTGSLVAFTGTIGFVGLIVPHMVRSWLGTAHRKVVPASFAVGAIFMLLVDSIARSWLPVQLPIGVVTAILGVPFFLVLLRRVEYRFG